MSKKNSNPGYGKAFTFHGSFHSLILARRREREIPGSFLVKRDDRYYVLKPKKVRTNPKKTIDPKKYWYGKGFDDATLGIRKRNRMKEYLRGYRDGLHYTATRKKYGFNPGQMPTPRTTRYGKYRVNPRKGILIYGKVLKIFAEKTSGPYKGQRFVHTFKRGAVMTGMPDGSIRISHP